mmetsp:Transcript_12483/g.18167  ORF Transcript_12483/g.18167 Transcript_12483/m.18167 type:complete len:421 (-) Transcript_12483:100-1362(-)|eukprot:CAMPEP_0197247366 /NCGR_PEP_ID=MMETSP1429-20130617/29143_1 /TAXON_ID=49237 /ORGANISM="Chaetoceros  sp., Strain UNC1202" /LENGTH=420 /DNA_ID=CAMNT_0042708261 /DNA_START=41 /DNA_END=1303 /DNA_ORIENTATION=-
MHLTSAALLALVSVSVSVIQSDAALCDELKSIPINDADFGEPDWESILEQAFPTWSVPDGGCPRLDSVGGTLLPDSVFPTPEEGKFNPCYYTKAVAGLDPKKGGYPTPIDTHYPYEFAAPFLQQPGDGSVHHCATDAVNIAECPKLGNTCGPDCATITDDYGIGHIPPFVPLAAIKNEYNSCTQEDICAKWFHYETSGCNIKKSVLDEMVYKYFGVNETVTFQPPILIDGQPSSTYFRLEYGGESPACDEGNCRGPHYCSVDVAEAGVIWGDFCPYVHTGENSGKYRHPHLALAALELWVANQCIPDKCPQEWLESPNGQKYGMDETTATSITWCDMDDNDILTAQPSVPYKWPNMDKGVFPGLNLYGKSPMKASPGVYVNEVVDIQFPKYKRDPNSAGHVTMSWFLKAAFVIACTAVAF